MSFDQYMQAQCEAIERALNAGEVSDPMTWIEQHAEAFRAAHPVTEPESVEA